MKPQDWQLTNLELSLELKKLRVKQESVWYWEKKVNAPHFWHLTFGSQEWDSSQINNLNIASAFTVAEHGKALPNCYASYRRGTNTTHTEWICMDNRDIVHFFANTEANVRAKMRIYLIKKKLLKEKK